MPALRLKFSAWFADTFVPAFFPRVNPLVRRLLRSRLHPLLGWYVVLLVFEGRRTGRHYEVPVTYNPAPDGTLEVVTSPRGRWWRNLDGAAASVVFKGKEQPARVDVIVDDPEVVTRALDSRDRCRRVLMLVPPERAVLLRFRLMPGAEGRGRRTQGPDESIP